MFFNILTVSNPISFWAVRPQVQLWRVLGPVQDACLAADGRRVLVPILVYAVVYPWVKDGKGVKVFSNHIWYHQVPSCIPKECYKMLQF